MSLRTRRVLAVGSMALLVAAWVVSLTASWWLLGFTSLMLVGASWFVGKMYDQGII